MSYRVVFSKQAQRDAQKLARSNLKERAESILEILRKDPFEHSPPFETLLGDLRGAYSRRINIQHRLVYQVYEKEKVVKVLRMWAYYG